MYSDSTFDYVIALDAATGDERWRFEIDSTYVGHDGSHNGPISTPLIDGSRVYGLGPKGHLIALELQTGELVWSKHLVDDYEASAPFYGFSTAPLIENEVLIVETGGDGTAISGFDKNMGELLWATGSDTIQYQSPIVMEIDGRRQLLGVGNRHIYGIDPQTGDELWSYSHGGEPRSRGGRSINPVVAGRNRVFVPGQRARREQAADMY